jgi:hypothetical protein
VLVVDVVAHDNVLKGQIGRVEMPIIKDIFIIKHFSTFSNIFSQIE